MLKAVCMALSWEMGEKARHAASYDGRTYALEIKEILQNGTEKEMSTCVQ